VFLSEIFRGDVREWDVNSVPTEKLSNIEADSYWCFCKVLDSIQEHYTFAQPGIQKICFKISEVWLLPLTSVPCCEKYIPDTSLFFDNQTAGQTNRRRRLRASRRGGAPTTQMMLARFDTVDTCSSEHRSTSLPSLLGCWLSTVRFPLGELPAASGDPFWARATSLGE